MRPFAYVDMHALLVAGAAAGAATVFKAPLTGVIFALEVPNRTTFERSAVVPALVGSTAGCLTLIGLKGTDPIFGLDDIDITVGYVFGAVVLGVICGVCARAFAHLIHRAEHAMGGMVGAVVADVGSVAETGLYVLVGAAAFLGAGYGTPIAATAFVAESTGLAGFLIPGAAAVTAAQLVMSNRTGQSRADPPATLRRLDELTSCATG